MLADLFKAIESDRVAGEFYLASDTDWLCRWMGRLPAVAKLEELTASNPLDAERLAARTLKVFHMPVAPGYRTEHEPALCCYAFVLSRIASKRGWEVLKELYTNAGPSHGWLRRVLDRCLRDDPAADRRVEAQAAPVTEAAR